MSNPLDFVKLSHYFSRDLMMTKLCNVKTTLPWAIALCH